MKKFKYIILLITVLSFSCSDSFLDVKPLGTIDSSLLLTPTNADALVTAAYGSMNSLAIYADWRTSGVRSDDAYKGGAGPADVAALHPFEMYNTITPDNSNLNGWWTATYNCISRCNKALVVLNQLTDAQMPTRATRIAEARFLRANFHFLLKRLFKYPVYVDETMTPEILKTISNRAYTDDQLWDKIAADFQYAYDNLPATNPPLGRANKYAAAAYLAKTRLYQAYEQDANNNVVNINQTKLQQVVTLCDVVINSAKYSLFDNFGKNFLQQYDNGTESIFAIQYSMNDGSTNDARANGQYSLNYNMAPGYGCCWFNVPTQNLVNAFKTVNGLPAEDFNTTSMVAPADFLTNTVDPRLDHPVGVPTNPFKYKLTFVYATNWARTPATYGPYSVMKDCELPTSSAFKPRGAFFISSKNIDIIRYDDVLLMKAEALIELNRADEALPIINQIRTRAANTDWLKYADNTTFSNYNVATYQPGVNCTWDQAYGKEGLSLLWKPRASTTLYVGELLLKH
jgi:starch-binding outer membrane protein, SusD/RagB family